MCQKAKDFVIPREAVRSSVGYMQTADRGISARWGTIKVKSCPKTGWIGLALNRSPRVNIVQRTGDSSLRLGMTIFLPLSFDEEA